MDNTNENYQGHLFSSIGYKSDKDVRNLIDNLTVEQSYIFLSKALEYAYSQGVYSMTETEIISKSLSIMSSKIINYDSTGQRGDNQ